MSNQTADPSASLVVFDRLEVGPVRLEPDRLSAPYRLVTGKKEEETQLVYKFEEEVFDISDSSSRNLADMMAVQVALNYGLFCRKIVFHGSYDQVDRRFIKDMSENTAREIYVLKFLYTNPFLVGEAAGLKFHPHKKERYLNAQLEFPEPGKKRKHQPNWGLWHTDRRRHAVLSSGGKDSLLSTGLLQELGVETHPIFINESGRHWFTALNGYRYFKEHVPRTGRTWTNSDRVFNWMLRRMPFIRQDFARLRSDEYPIRLWTVAVFLFGALPLMKKRGIARLIIGDEFDTTVRGSYKGITHYNGLYDQSRYFDNTMSRYFMKKGWNMNQFSLLRPLSEMLIQEILVKRYPHFQAHQVSCHAAHKEGERVKPCGRCEKCRRIVGMLKALDADPTLCGYSEEAIAYCLEQVVKKGVHQESAGGRHLLYLLYQKKIVPAPTGSRGLPRPHPEIMHLRFYPERSSIDCIPIDLRIPLFRVFLEHAEGALVRIGREWKDFDVFSADTLNRPYSFELPPVQGAPVPGPEKGISENGFIWGELTWIEARERIKEVDIALLPVGSIEQHGPHLPLDTDAFDAEYLCRQVAGACSNPKPFVLPLVPYGVSYEHDAFKGTISITNDTLSRYIYDIGISLAHNGINKLVIINGHGGNTPALNYAAQMINRDARIFVCVDSGETSEVDIYKLIHTPNDVHAGEIETSTSLAIRPHLVKMHKAPSSVPQFSSRYLNFTSKRWVQWYGDTKNVSADGVLGDASRADAEKGRKIWQVMIAHLVALVEDLKPMTLAEIYHKKY
jgi:creatinine amidohydrolase/Fe(II)-dependent formamide hydrolase-like protein/7-cyano-7-deazaguanine synthase in queuosine biosynthesis